MDALRVERTQGSSARYGLVAELTGFWAHGVGWLVLVFMTSESESEPHMRAMRATSNVSSAIKTNKASQGRLKRSSLNSTKEV